MKRLLAILMVFALCACLFVGCSGNSVMEREISKESSFVIVENGECYYVVYHKDTKVMYTISTGGSNYGNFSLLVNADGTPMIWEGE